MITVSTEHGEVATLAPHAGDAIYADELLTWLALELINAAVPTGFYVLTVTGPTADQPTVSTSLHYNVERPITSDGESIAWGPTLAMASPADRMRGRHEVEQFRLMVRHVAEREAFEADYGTQPEWHTADPVGDPSGVLGRARAKLDALEPVPEVRRAPRDVGDATELAGDLADGHRPLTGPASQRQTGASDAHWAEHYEGVASGDAHTMGERSTASLLALGRRVAERTEVAREHGDDIGSTLVRIAEALESLADTAREAEEAAHAARTGWLRRAWRRVVH